MNILLVEPDYNNKYPPLALMKLSRYHKNKEDYVFFYKGKYENSRIWDRIYITTLFTFDCDITIDTINFYKSQVRSLDDIYVGGIMASIMPAKVAELTGLKNIIVGRLNCSSKINFDDNVNIDLLPLDYDILYDTKHNYPAGDNFFGYTTRGCVNKCDFCAVPKIEGSLILTNNIYNQVEGARNTYGDKRNLLLLDNNILGLEINDLKNIVSDINRAGFTNRPNYKKPLKTDVLLNAYYRHLDDGRNPGRIIDELQSLLAELSTRNIAKATKEKLNLVVSNIGTVYEDEIDCIKNNVDLLREIETKASRRNLLQRYVDFNQGMDARELTEEKMRIISNLPIRPFRIAYDHVKYTDIYTKAMRLAHQYGVMEFSNYILYNYDDKPEDLYERLEVNVSLAEEFGGKHIYSFPMLFAPVNRTNRGYVGKHWNKQYLKNVRAVLNVTKGVFAGDRSFFEKAFGKNIDEFYLILVMPKDLLTYRKYFEDAGITQEWKEAYLKLSDNERAILLEHISNSIYHSDDAIIEGILKFHRMNYPGKKKKRN